MKRISTTVLPQLVTAGPIGRLVTTERVFHPSQVAHVEGAEAARETDAADLSAWQCARL